MSDTKISNLIELTAPVAEDELVIVDKSDTTMAASGTTKKITKANLVLALLEVVYPVGSVYTNKTVSTNPATLFGFGTWVAIAGRVVVGLDAGQTEFDTAGETGGAKTHTLTTTEIPSHSHNEKFRNPDGSTGSWAIQYNNNGGDIVTTENEGGGGAHNNLQPYVVCYVWERTA